jgi:S-adenosylmethionine synthetase
MKEDFVFVSESVTKGHPDKLCDQISDAIVDGFLERDPAAHIDAECAVSTGIVFIAAHFASSSSVDLAETARRVIRAAGYNSGAFNADDCTILTSLHEDGNAAASRSYLDEAVSAPAQQQATVFGYACRDTPALMPIPVTIAHDLARALDRARESGELAELSPDGKTQVAVEYRARKPVGVHGVSIVVKPRQGASLSGERLRNEIMQSVITPVLEARSLAPRADTRIFVNSEPSVAAGGPSVHSGLTGRKTAVDTYGEFARHSGSALSGKDPLRIDRMGAYAARYAAKNVVAAGLATECEVQLSYSIGETHPVSLSIDSFGTSKLGDEELTRRVAGTFDFRPGAILRDFAIRERFRGAAGSFFLPLATYGHMGRDDLGVPWESTDKIRALQDRRAS